MIDIPLETSQLVVVVTPSWESHQGMLYQYEKGEDWKLLQEPYPIVIGVHGMIASHLKKEGDGKTPAGIFKLGPSFGFNPIETKMEFLQISHAHEAVDDPSSRYYNQIVLSEQIQDPDWTSSEKMAEIPVYEMGLVVQYNMPNPTPGAGSAIFMHIWSHEDKGTAGCTAMSYDSLQSLLKWLDPAKHPRLIQTVQSEICLKDLL